MGKKKGKSTKAGKQTCASLFRCRPSTASGSLPRRSLRLAQRTFPPSAEPATIEHHALPLARQLASHPAAVSFSLAPHAGCRSRTLTRRPSRRRRSRRTPPARMPRRSSARPRTRTRSGAGAGRRPAPPGPSARRRAATPTATGAPPPRSTAISRPRAAGPLAPRPTTPTGAARSAASATATPTGAAPRPSCRGRRPMHRRLPGPASRPAPTVGRPTVMATGAARRRGR